MRMFSDEGSHIHVLTGAVVEHDINGKIVVTDKTNYHYGFGSHSFRVILVTLHMDMNRFVFVRKELEYDSEIFVDGWHGVIVWLAWQRYKFFR